jgi:hypothetical protein
MRSLVSANKRYCYLEYVPCSVPFRSLIYLSHRMLQQRRQIAWCSGLLQTASKPPGRRTSVPEEIACMDVSVVIVTVAQA